MNVIQGRMLEQILEISRAAGAAILEVYGGPIEVRGKADASPVTEADERAEALILDRLQALFPKIPVISEEAAAQGFLPSVRDRFFLVDPLDGTREFIGRNGEFTVNIALIEEGVPTLGVVLAPALDRVFGGFSKGGAFVEEAGRRRAIASRRPPPGGLTVVSSRSHGDREALEAFLAGRPVARSAYAGSSLKFCLVAAGEADLYPRLGRTMEWDTAAGHAVLAAAGGSVRDLSGSPLRYGKAGYENPHFVAEGWIST
ncbi:MAG: 3'(2'),5'-bisphosphate nucleotidase CysQ [Vicinamibacteria bacterium]